MLFSADIGEHMMRIDKASGGERKSENFKNDVNDKFEISKADTIHNMGFTDRQARDFQTLAKHPDVIQIECLAKNGDTQNIFYLLSKCDIIVM